MSPSTLSNIKQLFQTKSQMTNDVIESYINLLKYYKKGMWIYPGVIKRKLNIPISDVYESLGYLENQKIVCSYFELYCNNCQRSMGDVFESFNEIPDEFECEVCHGVFSGLENTILIYKVIIDD